MAAGSRMTSEDLKEALTADLDLFMHEVVEAVSDAPDSDFIGGSEMQVFRAGQRFRQKAFEHALNLRTQAAEADFSPSGLPQG